MPAFRHPVVAVSHGPGPLWLLADGIADMNKNCVPAQTLATIFNKLYPTGTNLPKRILFVSAHWESKTSGFEISNAANPKVLYDYYGFSPKAYKVVYPAKGDSAFAQRVKQQLEKNNIEAKLVDRGFDHGVFVPMLLIRPEADIPIVTMSINSRLSNDAHLDLGKILAPFRDEDTLIMTSGQSTHNLNGVTDPNHPLVDWAASFQDWLDKTMTSKSDWTTIQREEQLKNWQTAPGANRAHPTPDHFLPFVVAGGAGMEPGHPGGEGVFGGWGAGHLSFANYVWGI